MALRGISMDSRSVITTKKAKIGEAFPFLLCLFNIFVLIGIWFLDLNGLLVHSLPQSHMLITFIFTLSILLAEIPGIEFLIFRGKFIFLSIIALGLSVALMLGIFGGIPNYVWIGWLLDLIIITLYESRYF